MQPAQAGTEKARLRAELGARRRLRTAADLHDARAAIREHVLRRCTDESWRSVAAYEPMRTEPGSGELLAALADRGVQVIVPRVLDDRDLDWIDFPDDHRHGGPSRGARSPGTGSLGIGAIGDVDAVLVPALAVAVDGTRLGRGGGSYDRALNRVRPATPVAALLFEGELVTDLPREHWDIAVNAVVTPSGWRGIGESAGRPQS